MADWFVDGTWRLATRMGEDVVLQRASAAAPARNVRRIPLPGRVLRRELERALTGHDPWARAQLVEIWRAVAGHDAFWGYAPTETELRAFVLPQLLEALDSGTLVAFREERPRPHPVPGLEPPDEQPEPPAEDELTWIGVQVLDGDGAPVPGARYELELTDGSVMRGRTDREGVVRVEGIPAGNCKLRLPDFENDVVPGTPAPEEPAPAETKAEAADEKGPEGSPAAQTVTDEAPETPTILEAHVKDRAGQPIANRRFRATFDDGSTRDGTTDGSGLVRLEDCPPGSCKLTFLPAAP